MSRLPLLSMVAGLVLVAALFAPGLSGRTQSCSVAMNATAFQAAHQAGESVEFVEGLIRRFGQFDMADALRPWQTCAGDVADGVADGFAVAWAALESRGLAIHDDSLIGQALALLSGPGHHGPESTAEFTQASNVGNGDAKMVPLTWTVLRPDLKGL